MFIGLNLLKDYKSCDALELLAKDQFDLLQTFKDCVEDPFKPLSGLKVSIETYYDAEMHKISLLRILFEISGGTTNCRQQCLDQRHTFNKNLNLYGSIVGVNGAGSFGRFDEFLKSKAFEEDPHICPLDTVEWSLRMMQLLPIGFQEGYLVRSS